MYDPLNNQNEQNLNRSEQVSGENHQSSDTGYSAAYTESANRSAPSAGDSQKQYTSQETGQSYTEAPKTYYNPGYGGYSQ